MRWAEGILAAIGALTLAALLITLVLWAVILRAGTPVTGQIGDGEPDEPWLADELRWP